MSAIIEYNGLLSSANFTRVYNENAADLIIKDYYSYNDGVCGFADFPTLLPTSIPGTGLGYEIIINSKIELNLFYWNNLTSRERKFLVAHELGHILGIRHTNWRQTGEGEFHTVNGTTIGAYTVPNTNNSSLNPDPSSIFNGGSCGRQWPLWGSGFTNDDQKAIVYVANAWVL